MERINSKMKFNNNLKNTAGKIAGLFYSYIHKRILAVMIALGFVTALVGCTAVKTDAATVTSKTTDVDVIYFMGQSNMSGRGGDAALAPMVKQENGAEFRAYSDPNGLYPISEPFGKSENNPKGLHEKSGNGKKGSMVSSFVNTYHELTGRKIIAVSVSAGGVAMDLWNTVFYDDVADRVQTTEEYLRENNINVGKTYVVWMQGESDEGREVSGEAYSSDFLKFFDRICEYDIDEVFVVMHCPGNPGNGYSGIVDAQMEICKTNPKFCLATTVLRGIGEECYSDEIHVNQQTLNMVGQEAAKAVAYYTNTGKEPVIYNYLDNNAFVPEGSEELIGDIIDRIDLSNVNEKY